MNLRRVFGIAIAIAIAAGAFEPFYLRMFAMNRAGMRARLTALPYTKLPGSRQFLLGVRDRTREGDVIAIYAPPVVADRVYTAPDGSRQFVIDHRSEGRWYYFFARSLYPLAGRRVVPLDPNALRGVDYVASYRSMPPLPGFTLEWESEDGTLLRRAR